MFNNLLDIEQVRGAECVVMAGDPKQLPPTLQSDGALDAQLDRTLFDRLQDSGVCHDACKCPVEVSSLISFTCFG